MKRFLSSQLFPAAVCKAMSKTRLPRDAEAEIVNYRCELVQTVEGAAGALVMIIYGIEEGGRPTPMRNAGTALSSSENGVADRSQGFTGTGERFLCWMQKPTVSLSELSQATLFHR